MASVHNNHGPAPQRRMASDYDNFGPAPQLQKTSVHNSAELGTQDHSNEPSSSTLVPNVVPSANTIDPSLNELELLFDPLYEELFNAGNQKPIIPPTNVNAKENNNHQAEDARFKAYEFINSFCTPVKEVAESSLRNIDTSNMHTFYQRQRSEYHWTKDHPLEQVHGNPSKPVQTRRQLATDPEMCMFALTMSTTEPKNIKEAMVDHAWIEEMQEELHQFDRLNLRDIVKKSVLILKNLLHQSLIWKLFEFSLPTLHTNHLLSIRWTDVSLSVGLCSSWFLVKSRHRYAVSSLMDTAYSQSEQFL
ncbi:hypothetical protein Tco_0518170 [Tanacetum coccineum]